MNDNKTILRGQIYHINLDPDPKNKPIGSEMWPDRPGIIVSNDTNNKFSNTVEVVYLTTKIKRKYSPTHVKIRPAKRPSLALCEQICTIDRSRLGTLIDTVSDADMELIDQALAISIGLSTNPHTASIFHKWELYINKYNLEIGMQLKKLFDDQYKHSSAPAESSETVKKLQAQIAALTRERDISKALHDAAQKRLEATESERDEYKRLYELVNTTAYETVR